MNTGVAMAAPIILTAREMQVLLCLVDGDDNAEIAAEMYLSRETVKSHMKHLVEKLGARNRTHVVALAYHHGLLTPARRAA